MVVSLSFHLVPSLYSQPSVGTSSRSVLTLLNPPTFWCLSPISQWPFTRKSMFLHFVSISTSLSYRDRILNVGCFSMSASRSLSHLSSCKLPVYQSGHHGRDLYCKHSGSSNLMFLRNNKGYNFETGFRLLSNQDYEGRRLAFGFC